MKKIGLFLLICFGVINTTLADATLQIEVKEQAVVGGLYIRLGEIADLYGSDEALTKEAKNFVIAKAPFPGVTMALKELDIRACLKRNNLSEKDYLVKGSEVVKVRTKGRYVKGAEIVEKAKEFLLPKIPWDLKDVEIEARNKPADFWVKEGELTFKASTLANNYTRGNAVIIVQVYLDGEKIKELPVNLSIRMFDKVLIAQRSIGREEFLSLENITIERREISQVTGTPIKDIKETINMVAKNRIRAQSVVTKEMLQKPILIERGGIVNIIFSSGNLHVSAKGIAQKKGRLGDVIVVKNLDSQKELLGEVLSSGIVRIDF